MASGRIDFTQSGNSYIATGFIETASDPDTITPIASVATNAGDNGQQLAFNLAREANLTLTAQDYATLDWDEEFTGGDLQVVGSTNSLFPMQFLQNLTADNSDVDILPPTGAGPWTVSYGTPSLVTSNATAGTLAGGTSPSVEFTATNNMDATQTATADGMRVSWSDVVFIQNGDRYPQTGQSFLTTLNGYNYGFRVENISTTTNARWFAQGTVLQGTATVDGQPNTAGFTSAIGTANNVPVSVTNYPFYYLTDQTAPAATVPTDTIRIRYRRPASITGAAQMQEFFMSHNVDDQPVWTYPLWWFAQAQSLDAPTTSAPFLTGTEIQSLNRSRTRALGNLNITYTNTSAVNEWVYVCLLYTSPSPRDS